MNFSYPNTWEDLGVYKQYGWVCPKCEKVLAPTISFCLFCAAPAKQEAKPDSTGIDPNKYSFTTGARYNENHNSWIKKHT